MCNIFIVSENKMDFILVWFCAAHTHSCDLKHKSVAYLSLMQIISSVECTWTDPVLFQPDEEIISENQSIFGGGLHSWRSIVMEN